MVPRLWLRDANLRGPGGVPLATLSDIQSSVALKPLLRGELQPGFIRLSGAQLKLRRSSEGAVGLTVGEADAPVEEAANFAELVQQLDAVLLRPSFAALKEIEADNLTVRYEDARAERAWTVDGRDRLTYISPGLAAFLGRPVRDMVGRPLREVLPRSGYGEGHSERDDPSGRPGSGRDSTQLVWRHSTTLLAAKLEESTLHLEDFRR